MNSFKLTRRLTLLLGAGALAGCSGPTTQPSPSVEGDVTHENRPWG